MHQMGCTKMLATEELNDDQWKVVHDIAEKLADEQIKIDRSKDTIETEAKKILSYFVQAIGSKNSGEHTGRVLFDYLDLLKKNSSKLGHGKTNTSNYYMAIESACKKLKRFEDDPKIMSVVLGWSIRLIRFYKRGERVSVISGKTVGKHSKTTNPKQKTTMAAAFEKLGLES